MLKVWGVLCGQCAGCSTGGEMEDGRYKTHCQILATDVENTESPADFCTAFIAEPTDQ